MANKFEQGAISREELEIKSEAELQEAKLLVARYQKAIAVYEAARGVSALPESPEKRTKKDEIFPAEDMAKIVFSRGEKGYAVKKEVLELDKPIISDEIFNL